MIPPLLPCSAGRHRCKGARREPARGTTAGWEQISQPAMGGREWGALGLPLGHAVVTLRSLGI